MKFNKIKKIVCIVVCFMLLNSCKRAGVTIYDEQLFGEIYRKCIELDTSYFLDYLSTVDYSSLNKDYYYLVSAMRDFNIALDPLFRNSPMQAIKNLNKLNDEYDFDIVSKYIRVDTNTSIKNLEWEMILKNDYSRNKCLYFGRLNNNTPIKFRMIDKISNDYLLLQDGTFDLELTSDEVYKDSVCILKDNEYIKNCFLLEEDLIKDIFIFTKDDYVKYKNASKYVDEYIDVEIGATISPSNKKLSYWVKENDETVKKFFDGFKYVEAMSDEKCGVRLAILVKGDLYEK